MVRKSLNKVLKFGISGLILIYSMVCYGDAIWLEAENAALTGVNKAASQTGYSGTGYVTGFDANGDKITFTFDATGRNI